MKLYLAAPTSRKNIVVNYPNRIDYILESFYYIKPWLIDMVNTSRIKSLLLDSGAFTLFKANSHLPEKYVDEYVQKYIDYINQNEIELFFELDIDSIVGRLKVEEIRQKINRGTGKLSIPAWHKSRGIKNFIELAKDYPYIAIGGIASKEIKKPEYAEFHKLIDIAHKHGAKIHGLGFTPLNELSNFDFDSVDSSSWSYGSRSHNSSLYKFTGNSMICYSIPPGRRRKHHTIIDSHNFHQWCLYQRYLNGASACLQ